MKKIAPILFCVLLTGCHISRVGSGGGNEGQMQSFGFHMVEPAWIRNGEPIEFEGEMWFPQDGVESLLDNEVIYLGEYRSVQYFIDKVDVRPYDRLYTKFAKNKFRYFERQIPDDQDLKPAQSVRQ